MKRIILLMGILLFSWAVEAQNVKLPSSGDLKKAEQDVKKEADKSTSQTGIGKLIGQLTGSISDGAFTDAFKKDKSNFISKVNNVKDANGASNALQTLQGGMLPSAMEAGWGKVKDKWIKDAKTANTVKSVAAVTQTLEANIKDSSFKGSWSQARPAWQAALGALAK